MRVTGTGAWLLLLGAMCTTAFGIAMRGFCLYKFWGWFAMPLGAPQIGVLHAYGISMLLCVFMPQGASNSKDSKGNYNIVLTPLLYLLFGWIIHLFM